MIYRKGKKVESEDLGQEPEDSGEETTLIPKSLLPDGVKAGDEVRLKVVHSYEDELEVSYQHSKKADNDNGETSSPDMDRANSDLDALASPTEA